MFILIYGIPNFTQDMSIQRNFNNFLIEKTETVTEAPVFKSVEELNNQKTAGAEDQEVEKGVSRMMQSIASGI